MREPVKFFIVLYLLGIFNNEALAQNSMTGDGFGGRGWYTQHNIHVGSFSAHAVCGDSNQLYSWGTNAQGQFGNGTYISSDTPVAAIGMTNVKFHTTDHLSAAIKYDSTAWVWGTAAFIFSHTVFSTIPSQILSNVRFVDVGIDRVVFVKYDGTVWLADIFSDGLPTQINGINNAVRAITLGGGYDSYATMILLADSTVKIAGGFGTFQNISNSTTPIVFPGLNNIIDIKGNFQSGYALNSRGEVYSFGIGPLGYSSNPGPAMPPTKIVFPSGASSIVALSSKSNAQFCLALDSNHHVYAWGGSQSGQFGCGVNCYTSTTPILVASDVVDIFAGTTFSYILKSDNTLWATGYTNGDNYGSGYYHGSIWMNLSNTLRHDFTQIDPLVAPMYLCAPKVTVVLPVKLFSFSCEANANSVNINWQSAEETNLDKYVIEYSSSRNNFRGIANVFAKGSNSTYTYIHQQVSGTAFYRLKMIDKDNNFKYSEIRAVKFKNNGDVTVVPNPTQHFVSVFSKQNTIIRSIDIFTVEGKKVKTMNYYYNGQQIDISDFSNGVYFLKIIYSNGVTNYLRFLKK